MEIRFRNTFNLKKKNNIVILVIMGVVLTLFINATLAGCSSNSVPDTNNPSEDDKVYTEDGKIAFTRLYNGKTAIIKEDTEIYDAYVIDFSEVDSGAEDQLRLTLRKVEPKINDSSTFLLRKNDMVVVLEEADEYCRVFVPYGTPATLRGKVERNAISYDISLFASANQAVLDNVSAYDDINGIEVGLKNGRGTISERNDGWALITLPGGEPAFWVKESALSFDFDMPIEDVDPY
jgi:hypothetical protein